MNHYNYDSNPIVTGGEKVVHRGVCVETGLAVVIKFLRRPYGPADVRRLKLEIDRNLAARRTSGPWLNPIIDHNLAYDPPFVVEEYFPDGTLAEKMAAVFAKGKVFVLGAAVGYCRQILQALHGIHASGQIHRDVKPSNVLYRANGKRLTLTDMGIGRTLARPTVLQTRAFCGTRGYAAPEQELASSGFGVDHRADLYAVGVILHEMLTRRRGSWDDITYSNDPRVGYLLSRLLVFDRDSRFNSAAETIREIDGFGIATR